MVAKCLKKILLLLFITGAIQANAQKGKKSELQQWKDFIENARLIARQERGFDCPYKGRKCFAKERVCTGK